ncbi:T9SS type A sorting domain-containing protein [Psychroserpens sp.]|uniref:T9SS type A sorting domain-containing protein n=1 Tax=Psychroserpens sp. TaxID=2020870 RepID=UPI00385D45DC
MPYNDFNDIVIALGLRADSGDILTISLVDNSLPANINVYLEDTLKNTLTLLNESDYRFTPSNDLIGTGRFFLRYSANTIASLNSELDNILIYSNYDTKEVVIKGHLAENSNAILYDIHGRVIINHELETSNSVNTINVAALNTGVYILQLSDGNSTKTQKLIIK